MSETNSDESRMVSQIIQVAPTDDTNQNAVLRRSKRSNAGRMPARFATHSAPDNNSTESIAGGISCGNIRCSDEVKEGIKCNNCSTWFHCHCAQLSPEQFTSYSNEQDLLWFCSNCLVNPMLRFLTTIIQRQERLINSLQNRLELIESTNHPQSNISNSYVLKDSGVHPSSPICPEPPQHANSFPTRVSPSTSKPASRATRTNDLTVICTNMPEPVAPSLKERHESELKNWNDLCAKMNISVEPACLTRLTRHPSSEHANLPRLLRVTLKNMEDVESVLLSAYKLRSASVACRIFPDIPWSQRQQKKEKPSEARITDQKRAVFVHGIPESPNNDESEKRAHDCREWKFIQELIGTKGIITTGMYRIPYSPNYKGSGPRILKVLLLNEVMVTTLLETWYAKRSVAPPELRIRPTEIRSKITVDARVDHESNAAPLENAQTSIETEAMDATQKNSPPSTHPVSLSPMQKK